MTYEEARSFIDWTATIGYRLGLNTIREMLRRLGNPQDDLKFIHIAGTNGKGSVLAYTSTVLKEAGYRVGRYISPTIYSYRERIQVNEEYISRDDLTRLTEKIREAGQAMLEDGFLHSTCFEVETVLAFLYFKEQKCDLVVLETGMGGLTDATNVIKNTLVSVLTPISMDHMSFLGDTLEQIAVMKAGIIKPEAIVVSAKQKPEAAQVIKNVCKEHACRLMEVDPDAIRDVCYGWEKQSFSYKAYKDLEISLAGSYQIENAALAIEVFAALSELGYEIPEAVVRKGLVSTVWSGRFTVIDQDPLFILDGAHNPDAADRLKETLELYFKEKRLVFIMGVLADKDYGYILQQLVPLADQIFTVMTPNNPRALPAEDLAKAIAVYNPKVQAADSLGEAVKLAKEAAHPEDVIIAFGSLSYLGELHRLVEKAKGN